MAVDDRYFITCTISSSRPPPFATLAGGIAVKKGRCCAGLRKSIPRCGPSGTNGTLVGYSSAVAAE